MALRLSPLPRHAGGARALCRRIAARRGVAASVRGAVVPQARSMGGVSSVWEAISPLPVSDPMVPVLTLSAAQIAMGGFDNVYHHELKERLPWSGSAAQEQRIHALRGGLYVGVFAALAGATPTGALAYGLAGVLVAETGLTLWDFVTEDATRKHRGGLPPTERITHTLLTLNYGAILACWLPIIVGPWASAPTGISLTNYGLPSLLCASAAGGIAAWTARDHYAAQRLQRFASSEATTPLLLNLDKKSTVMVTGGSGFIGQRLCSTLMREGHHVIILCRDAVTTSMKFEDVRGGALTIVTELDSDALAGTKIDAVVNLAGEPLAGARWSAERKARFYDSRVGMTERIAEFLKGIPEEHRPEVMVQGSAIGYYGVGMPGDIVTEDTPPAETASLSHNLCRDWEDSVDAVGELGVRTVKTRIGVVLGRDGGAMAQMLTPFEFGLGGPMGSGEQGMSWIHIDDMVRIIAEAINNTEMSGTFNATAPNPVTNAEFTKTLGSTMNRPTVLPVPGFAMKLLFGSDLAEEILLTGQMIAPKRLEEAGFRFLYPTVATAIEEVVKGRRQGGEKHD